MIFLIIQIVDISNGFMGKFFVLIIITRAAQIS